MPTIEELPDAPPPAPGPTVPDPSNPLAHLLPSGPIPSLSEPRAPPSQAELDATPLFMRSLPQDFEENSAIAALQSLAFEGEPDDVAKQFKEQGNEYYKGKRYREAVGFYTQGLEVENVSTDIRETLLVNRAACNLELQNYGQTLRDTSSALSLNPSNVKALYRAARALLTLEKLDEALNACEHALKVEPDNKGVLGVRERAAKRKEEKRRREEEKGERERRGREEERALGEALKNLGVVLLGPLRPPENPHHIHFDASFLPALSSPTLPLLPPNVWVAPPPSTPLCLPVLLLYPLAPPGPQSDFIASFSTSSTFADQITPVLSPPPPWDAAGEYALDNAVLYATTAKGRVLKVGKGLTLGKVLAATGKQQGDGMVFREGALNVVVLPKGEKEKKWVEEWKKARGA